MTTPTNKPQWTPGPWKTQQVAPQSQFSRFYVWQVLGNSTEIASDLVCTLPDYSKDNEANARLIAQAPAMAEALICMLAVFKPKSELQTITCRKARAVLAKVEGGAE